MKTISDTAGQGESAVDARAKGAGKARIMHIRAQPYLWDFREGDAIHLVQRRRCVAGAATAAQISIDGDFLDDLDADPAAESLKEIFVQQPGAGQLRIKRGNIAAIREIGAEFQPRNGLESNGYETSANSGARRQCRRIPAGPIDL